MTAPAHHELWFTPEHAEYDPADPDDRHELEIAVVCPGVEEGKCALWLECREGEHPDPETVNYEDTEVHGVTHMWFDGVWMTETNQCLHQWEWSHADDSARDVLADVQGIPGAYAVDAEWDGEYTTLTLAGEPVAL